MTDAASKRRRRTHDAGLKAERLAVLRLILSGHRILARRYAVSGGEIDIVARRGDVVSFVEVKARPTLEEAAFAIRPRKQHRIERAGAVWLARNTWAVSLTLRGDAILVAPRHWPRHVKDAFELRIG